MKIGEKIRKMRDLKGFSQENMAQAMSISPSAYGKIERDETDITFSKLQKIANVFQVTPIDIIKFNEQSILVNTIDNKTTINKGDFMFNQHNLEFAQKSYNDTIEAYKNTILTQKEFLKAKDEIIDLQKITVKQLQDAIDSLSWIFRVK